MLHVAARQVYAFGMELVMLQHARWILRVRFLPSAASINCAREQTHLAYGIFMLCGCKCLILIMPCLSERTKHTRAKTVTKHSFQVCGHPNACMCFLFDNTRKHHGTMLSMYVSECVSARVCVHIYIQTHERVLCGRADVRSTRYKNNPATTTSIQFCTFK